MKREVRVSIIKTTLDKDRDDAECVTILPPVVCLFRGYQQDGQNMKDRIVISAGGADFYLKLDPDADPFEEVRGKRLAVDSNGLRKIERGSSVTLQAKFKEDYDGERFELHERICDKDGHPIGSLESAYKFCGFHEHNRTPGGEFPDHHSDVVFDP